jgi:uncharacterized UPF0146 family protein
MLIDTDIIEQFCNNNMSDNRDQKVLFFNIICLLLNPFGNDFIKEERGRIAGDYFYILSNSIAKFSLALPTYNISENTLSLLNDDGFDEDVTYTRRKWYKNKNIVFDHMRPVNETRQLLLNIDKNIDFSVYMKKVLEILNDDDITIITKEEDNILNELKLGDKTVNGSVIKRYETANITLSDKKMKVTGVVLR